MIFNLTKAITDEEYARKIKISDNILYDDYIFILSIIYASNIDLSIWINLFKQDISLFKTLLNISSIEHCMNWNDSVYDIIDFCNLYKFNTNIYKSSQESRNYIFKNISPKLLTIFYNTNKITNDNIISVLLESYQ